MMQIRRAGERGTSRRDWLDSRHTFSFAEYHDPRHMGFGPLRVINDDRVIAGAGFGSHGHRDAEIISYVLEGALEHKDSIGTGSVIRRGDVQIMSAGTGIMHSEFNHSKSEPVHFLQIWVLPERSGLVPRYDEKHFSQQDKLGRLLLVVSPDGREGSLRIHQDVELRAAILQDGQRVDHELRQGRKAWLQVASGSARVNGQALEAGDGMAIQVEPRITIEGASEAAEVLLFDLR